MEKHITEDFTVFYDLAGQMQASLLTDTCRTFR
jgi:hypothetical protein